MAAAPDRNRLQRARVDAGAADAVPIASKANDILGPVAPQQLDLLIDTPAAIGEVWPKRFIFERIRPHRDTEPEASFAQHIDFGRLLGDQRGLALRQNEYLHTQFN